MEQQSYHVYISLGHASGLSNHHSVQLCYLKETIPVFCPSMLCIAGSNVFSPHLAVDMPPETNLNPIDYVLRWTTSDRGSGGKNVIF
jgi:hypothetical protein